MKICQNNVPNSLGGRAPVDTRYTRPPADPIDHWYAFLYDGQTGADIDGNIITLYFGDALRRDDQLIQDSKVADLGAPGFAVTDPATPTSGGGGPM